MEIKATAGHIGRTITVEYPHLSDELKVNVKTYGEQFVNSFFVRAGKIAVQSWLRSQMERVVDGVWVDSGVSDQAILENVVGRKLNETAPRITRSDKEVTDSFIKSGSKDDLLDLQKRVEAQLRALKG